MTRMTRSTPEVDYSLVATFEELRQQLEPYKSSDRLQKPLAYWVVAGDRRLPLPFLNRSVAQLIATPLEELFATAGIGRKKIRTLLTLLHRAAQPHVPGEIFGAEQLQDPAEAAADKHRNPAEVDPTIVSQALWEQWCASLRQHGLGRETLGRFAASLRRLPRVIWNTTLDTYLDLSLDEIRSLRTHGEKRLTAVLEIFGGLHALLVHLAKHPHLSVRIVPRFVVSQEAWLSRRLESAEGLTVAELRRQFIRPLVEQVRIDAGKQIARLVESRLNPRGATVRRSAQRLKVTRARIYQLLGEAADVIAVRWPDGATLVSKLLEKLRSENTNRAAVKMLETAFDLFFSRGAAELETAKSLRQSPQYFASSDGKTKRHAANGAKVKKG